MADPIERRLQELREIGAKYAKAKAEREYLDHFRKSKLAILMRSYCADFPTTAAQEREARSNPEYLELLKGFQEATETEARLFWELKVAMAGVEIWRSKQATMRAERAGYGA